MNDGDSKEGILPSKSAPPPKLNKSGSTLRAKEQQIVLNVQSYLSDKFNFKTEVKKETAKACGISVGSVYRISQRLRKEGKVVTPGKIRKGAGARPRKLKFSDVIFSAIRRNVHDYFMREERPTVAKILQSVEADEDLMRTVKADHGDDFKFSKTQIWHMMRVIGMKYKGVGRHAILLDDVDIVVWRHRYVTDIERYRKEGWNVVYADETVFENSVRTEEGAATGRTSTHQGGRLMVINAGNEKGFVAKCATVITADPTCRGDIHAETFETWFEGKLLPNLPAKSVVVLDNAPYHSARVEKIPKSLSPKQDIIRWLRDHDIEGWEEDMPRPVLYSYVKDNKSRFLKYRLDVMAEAVGHKVLRLPPYHCELNPIEMIWSVVEEKVTHTTSTGGVEHILYEAMRTVTPENWSDCCKYVKEKVEPQMRKLNDIQDELADRLPSDDDEEEFESTGSESDTDF